MFMRGIKLVIRADNFLLSLMRLRLSDPQTTNIVIVLFYIHNVYRGSCYILHNNIIFCTYMKVILSVLNKNRIFFIAGNFILYKRRCLIMSQPYCLNVLISVCKRELTNLHIC